MLDQFKKNPTTMYIAIGVVVLLLCCCCLATIIVFFQYDNWGDPLGVYGTIINTLPIV